MKVTIKIDETQMEELRRALEGCKAAPEKVMSRAINDAAKGTKTDISKETRNVLNIKKGDLDDHIKIIKATASALGAIVRTEGVLLPVIDFDPAQMGPGAYVKFYKEKAGQTFHGAFIAAMKTGHRGVFKRVRHTGQYYGAPVRKAWARMPRDYRLPIKEIFGPNLGGVVRQPDIMDPVMNSADERLKVAIDRETNYELSKL